MSAIMAAAQRLEDRRIDAVLGRAFTRGDELRAMIIAAGRAIVRASNAAGAGRVVEGAPRTRRVQWAGPGTTGEWTAGTTNGAAWPANRPPTDRHRAARSARPATTPSGLRAAFVAATSCDRAAFQQLC